MMKVRMFFLFAILASFIVPELTLAGFVSGEKGKEDFEYFRKEFCDSFVDFEEFDTGLTYRLYPFPVGLGTTYFRWPYPSGVGPAPSQTPVVVLPYNFVSSPSNHRLMGVTKSLIPDGQSRYEIVFDSLQKRAGLLRMWNTFSLTRFYGDNNKLLYQHQNNTNYEFVGYICDNNTPCIKRIELDGLPKTPESEDNKLYMVGEVDDLYFSVPALKLKLKAPPNVEEGEDAKLIITVESIVSYDIENIKVKIDYTFLDTEHEFESDYLKIPSRKTITIEYDINTEEGTAGQTIPVEARLFSPFGTEIDKITNNIFVTIVDPTASIITQNILLLLLKLKTISP